MTEVELKFQVPQAHRAALGRAMAGPRAKRLRLQATYFDTADRDLARAGLALRVRRQGRQWVQALKGAGDGMWQRLEHEVPLSLPRGVLPQADPALHDGTPAGDALRAALGDRALAAVHGTEVLRRVRVVRGPGCSVELAFDTGALVASDRRWPLCELEFELKSGDPAGVASLAAKWVRRFGLTLDVRSKAERGDRLARGLRVAPAVRAQPLALPEGIDADAALRAIAGNCLRQILGNASEIAHEAASPEHLHQLRVGLRRLRSALRELSALSAQVRPEWSTGLETLFRDLGAARDRDALAQALLPALQRAGATTLQWPAAAEVAPPDVLLRDERTTTLWLELLAFAAGAGVAWEVSDAFEPFVAARLQHLHRQVRRDAGRFGKLDDDHRHRLRKRLKRLRYLCEFAASCFDRRAVAAYLKSVEPAQDALGHFNDVCVARALLQPVAAQDAQAMFALGWLAHEHDDAVGGVAEPLARLRRARPFWSMP